MFTMLFLSARGGSRTRKDTTAAGFLFYLANRYPPIVPGKAKRRWKGAQTPRPFTGVSENNNKQKYTIKYAGLEVYTKVYGVVGGGGVSIYHTRNYATLRPPGGLRSVPFNNAGPLYPGFGELSSGICSNLPKLDHWRVIWFFKLS
jgi:hypothetical protein